MKIKNIQIFFFGSIKKLKKKKKKNDILPTKCHLTIKMLVRIGFRFIRIATTDGKGLKVFRIETDWKVSAD